MGGFAAGHLAHYDHRLNASSWQLGISMLETNDETVPSQSQDLALTGEIYYLFVVLTEGPEEKWIKHFFTSSTPRFTCHNRS